jgi:malonyl-CoA/methylmalonyl-CoA synthetase
MAVVVRRAQAFLTRTAVSSATDASVFSFSDLLRDSASFARELTRNGSIRGERVAYGIPPGYDYVVAQWGIWRAGGIAVPISASHPPTEIEYTLKQSDSKVVVGSGYLANTVHNVATACSRDYILFDRASFSKDNHSPQTLENVLDSHDPAMMIYTSGTTARPKGVLLSHGNLETQCRVLADYWKMVPEDCLVHALPLHHVHGIVNALTLPLYSGAHVHFFDRFAPKPILHTLAHISSGQNEHLPPRKCTVFMGVPTMYARMLEEISRLKPEEQSLLQRGLSALRLFISGSAALPMPILEQWKQLTGHTLLERYGMSEIGMALSNPYVETEQRPRKAGTVGVPLNTVETRIEESGELLIKGPSVFTEYWRNPKATEESFTADGWFRTGDIVSVDADGYYTILGRASVDILKIGGYKISALEIESALLESDALAECAVVGLKDETYGQKIVALLVFKNQDKSETDLRALKRFAMNRLAKYKVPQEWRILKAIPRNAMGKVNKKELVSLLERGEL